MYDFTVRVHSEMEALEALEMIESAFPSARWVNSGWKPTHFKPPRGVSHIVVRRRGTKVSWLLSEDPLPAQARIISLAELRASAMIPPPGEHTCEQPLESSRTLAKLVHRRKRTGRKRS